MTSSEGWVLDNHEGLGYDGIHSIRGWDLHNETGIGRRYTPDFAFIYNGEVVGVEVEKKLSEFLSHEHDPKLVDHVICFIDNVDLPSLDWENDSFIMECWRKRYSKEDFKKLKEIKIIEIGTPWKKVREEGMSLQEAWDQASEEMS